MTIRWMFLPALFAILFLGCDPNGTIPNDDDDVADDDVADDDTSDDDTDDPCSGYEYSMLNPDDGAHNHDPHQPLVFQWTERPPDAYTSLQDEWGNYVTWENEEVDGDHVVLWYDLQYERRYFFEAGWFCFEDGTERTITLIDIEFTTQPHGPDPDPDDDDHWPDDDDDEPHGDDDDEDHGDDDDAYGGEPLH